MSSSKSMVRFEHAVMLVVALVAIVLLMTGCTTGGLVVGPLSYLSAQANAKSVRERAVMAAQIPEEKKPQVFRAMVAGASEGEVSRGMGVDFLALFDAVKNQKLTKGEMALQFATVAGDVVLEGWALDKTLDKINDENDDESSQALPVPAVSGNNNTFIMNNTAPVSVDQSVTN